MAEVSDGWGGSAKRDSGAVVSGAVPCGAPESRLLEKAVMLPAFGLAGRLRRPDRCWFARAGLWWPVLPWLDALRLVQRLAEVGGAVGHAGGWSATVAPAVTV